MINQEKTIKNLVKLSFSDLEALKPFAGTLEKGWLSLIHKAIDIKVEQLIVKDEN